jgi:hypothetical protein
MSELQEAITYLESAHAIKHLDNDQRVSFLTTLQEIVSGKYDPPNNCGEQGQSDAKLAEDEANWTACNPTAPNPFEKAKVLRVVVAKAKELRAVAAKV